MTSEVFRVTAMALLFIVLGLWRMHDALLVPGQSLSMPFGDGLGSMGWIFEHAQRLGSVSWDQLISEIYRTKDFGGGLHSPAPTTLYWRIQYWLLSKLVAGTDDVYDLICLTGFVLNGAFTFLLARRMKLSIPVAVGVAVAAAYLPVFHTRVVGHLTLTAFWAQLLLFAAAAWAAQEVTSPRMAALGAAAWFSFLQNEYYGFFGAFFALVLFVASLSTHCSVQQRGLVRRILLGGAAGAGAFISLMAFSYPNLVLGGLLRRSPVTAFAHSDGDFSFYALHHVRDIFEPAWPPLRALTAGHFAEEPGELTFRIGLVLPLWIALMAGVVLVAATKRPAPERIETLKRLLPWVGGSFVMFCFSLTPNHAVSLVPLTRAVAPMFRVGVRALLFLDIGALVIAGILVEHFWKHEIPAQQWLSPKRRRRLLAVATCGIAALAARDTGALGPLTPIAAYSMPDAAIYSSLAEQPDGYLIELPFFCSQNNSLESDYPYMYNRAFHHKPVLNYMRDPDHASTAFALATLANYATEDTIKQLHALGVSYVTLHADSQYDWSPYTNSAALEILAQDASVTLLRFKNPQEFDSAKLELLQSSGDIPGGAMPSTIVDSTVAPSPLGGRLARTAHRSQPFNGEFLVYGPYMPQPPGRYRVDFVFSVMPDGPRDALRVGFDVFAQPRGVALAELMQGAEQLPTGALGVATLDYEVLEQTAVEFRVRIWGSARYTVHHIHHELKGAVADDHAVR